MGTISQSQVLNDASITFCIIIDIQIGILGNCIRENCWLMALYCLHDLRTMITSQFCHCSFEIFEWICLSHVAPTVNITSVKMVINMANNWWLRWKGVFAWKYLSQVCVVGLFAEISSTNVYNQINTTDLLFEELVRFKHRVYLILY